jgi:hypothetical protein
MLEEVGEEGVVGCCKVFWNLLDTPNKTATVGEPLS